MVGVGGGEASGRLFEVAAPVGTPIGKRLTLVSSGGQRAVFHRNVAIYLYDVTDRAAEAAAIAMLSRADLASDVDIAEAFGVHRNTVARLAGRVAAGGIAGVLPAKPGPKGPHKVTPVVRELVAANASLTAPALIELVERETGVRLSPSHVRRLRAAVQVELPIPGDGVVNRAAAAGT